MKTLPAGPRIWPMKLASWAILLAGAAGCASGGGLYPDTDVMEVKGYELKVATGVQKSGGLLQAGTLEYSGAGDLTSRLPDQRCGKMPYAGSRRSTRSSDST